MTGLAIVESPLQVVGLADALLAGDVGPLTVVARTASARATLRVLAPSLPVVRGPHDAHRLPGPDVPGPANRGPAGRDPDIPGPDVPGPAGRSPAGRSPAGPGPAGRGPDVPDPDLPGASRPGTAHRASGPSAAEAPSAAAEAPGTTAQPPGTTGQPPSTTAEAPGTGRHPRAGQLVLGDVLGGTAQSRLLAAPGRQAVVLVDDGTATLVVVDALLGRGPLVRPHLRVPAARRLLGAAAAADLLGRARADRLTLRTCLPLPEHDVVALAREGVTVLQHTLARVRALDIGPPVVEDVVVLGSALADDGLVDADAYDEWVARTIEDALGEGLTVRYLAHRREPASRLARLRLHGARAEASPLPAELRLRSSGGVRRVVSLPTSVLLTVGGDLAAAGVDVDAQAVPGAWWTSRATPALRTYLDLPRALHARSAVRQRDR